jgi:hypothetical protein
LVVGRGPGRSARGLPWKRVATERPIPVAPPVRTTTLSFRLESREGLSVRCAILYATGGWSSGGRGRTSEGRKGRGAVKLKIINRDSATFSDYQPSH